MAVDVWLQPHCSHHASQRWPFLVVYREDKPVYAMPCHACRRGWRSHGGCPAARIGRHGGAGVRGLQSHGAPGYGIYKRAIACLYWRGLPCHCFCLRGMGFFISRQSSNVNLIPLWCSLLRGDACGQHGELEVPAMQRTASDGCGMRAKARLVQGIEE
jgi:hypothetical protein